ncbi:MAG: DUF47 family protein [Mailhella sp.]|nr:DUF47 family protein [Mailhella sp.]
MFLERFLPRSAPYFRYFEQQNEILQRMAHLLYCVATPEYDSEEHIKEMNALELEGDKVLTTIVHELSRTFITPIDREDIYAISNAQENAIDSLSLLGRRVYLFSFVHTRFPAKKMLENIAGMSRLEGELLRGLSKKEVPEAAIKNIHGLKENCDMLLGVGLSELQDADVISFDMIKQLIVWSQLYDRIEASVNLFASLTDTLEQAILKYA